MMSTSTISGTVEEAREVSFPVTGMTCASCVRRIEKALNKVDGVQEASVNLATEKARVVFDPTIATFDYLAAAVAKAGYGVGELTNAATSPEPPAESIATNLKDDATDALDRERQREIDALKHRWMIALPVGIGMMALMYVPLPLDAMDILMPALLVVATFVQFWAGRNFYSAAWAAAKHGGTNMNTLVALGTLVA